MTKWLGLCLFEQYQSSTRANISNLCACKDNIDPVLYYEGLEKLHLILTLILCDVSGQEELMLDAQEESPGLLLVKALSLSLCNKQYLVS